MSEPFVSPSIEVRLHGAARVRTADGSEVRLERKQAAVIAWLASHGATPRSRLAGLLWPEVGEARARGNLRQCLSRLRQSAGVLIDDERGLLVLSSTMGVDPPAPGTAWLDAFSFDDCGDFDAWLQSERDAQRATQRQRLLAVVRDAARQGSLDHALEQADRLVAVDRESEEAYRALMEVLYLRGDRAGAIAVWDRCRDMLRSLYGVLPSAATERLGQTIVEASASTVVWPTTAIPVTLLRPPTLIGRAGQVEAMVASWRVGHAICVRGEAGVGKSRLLAEFASAVGPCAVASARPGDAVLPYASLSRLVLATLDRFQIALDAPAAASCARLLPQLASRLGVGEQEPLRTPHERGEALGVLSHLLDAALDKGCEAFVFDDLQFADAASVEALQALVERDGANDRVGPARLAFGSRGEEETATAQSLVAALGATRRLLSLELGPLDEAGVQALMRSLGLPGFDADLQAPRLRRRVGGNPAYLLESVKLIAALGQLGASDAVLPVPPGIEAVVERRIALLSPAARHIAELAAVAGESYGVDLASRALGRSLAELGEPLRELEWRQVLYGRHFVHDVVATAVRKTVPAVVGELLHRLVAGYLEETGGEAAVIAGHWRACGEWRRAADAFRDAARRARRAARPAEQAQLLDAAADCYLRCGAQADRFTVLYERQLVTAAPDYTRTRVEQIDRLEAAAGSEEQRLLALAARVAWHADHTLRDTLELGEQGLRRSIALGLDALAFEFAHPVAWQLATRGDLEHALEVIGSSERWALSHSDAWFGARFHTARSGIYAFSDRLGEAVAESEKSLEILRIADDRLEMLAALANLGLFLSWRGEQEAALRVLREAREVRDRLHGRGSSLLIELHYGAVLRDLGHYDESLAVLERVLAEFRQQLDGAAELRTDIVIGENHLAQLWLLVGDTDRAAQAMRTDDSSADVRFRARRAALQTRIARHRGRPDDARWAEAARLAEQMPPSFNRVFTELELVRGNEPGAALERLDDLLGSPSLRERPGLRMKALAMRADLRRAKGRRAAARRDGDALFALDAAGYLPFDAAPLSVWHSAHAALNETSPERAAVMATKAAAWLETVSTHIPVDARPAFARRHLASCRAMGIALPRSLFDLRPAEPQ